MPGVKEVPNLPINYFYSWAYIVYHRGNIGKVNQLHAWKVERKPPAATPSAARWPALKAETRYPLGPVTNQVTNFGCGSPALEALSPNLSDMNVIVTTGWLPFIHCINCQTYLNSKHAGKVVVVALSFLTTYSMAMLNLHSKNTRNTMHPVRHAASTRKPFKFRNLKKKVLNIFLCPALFMNGIIYLLASSIRSQLLALSRQLQIIECHRIFFFLFHFSVSSVALVMLFFVCLHCTRYTVLALSSDAI